MGVGVGWGVGGFNGFLPSFSQVWIGSSCSHWILLRCTKFHRVSSSVTGFYLVLPGFTVACPHSIAFDQVRPDSIWFHRVLPDWTRSCWVFTLLETVRLDSSHRSGCFGLNLANLARASIAELRFFFFLRRNKNLSLSLSLSLCALRHTVAVGRKTKATLTVKGFIKWRGRTWPWQEPTWWAPTRHYTPVITVHKSRRTKRKEKKRKTNPSTTRKKKDEAKRKGPSGSTWLSEYIFFFVHWLYPVSTRVYLVLLGFAYWCAVRLASFGFWSSLTSFYRVLPGFPGFLPSLTGFYWVLPSFTQFYRFLPSFTGFYWVLLGFTGFYLVLLGLTKFYWVFT